MLDAIEGSSPPRARRAKCLLLSHWGHSLDQIAREIGVDEATAGAWIGAYLAGGLPRVLGRRQRARKQGAERVARIRTALEELGMEPETASVRQVAAIAGLPTTTTFRLLRELTPPTRASIAPPEDEEEEEHPDIPEPPPFARILVVGCGGAGDRTIDRLHKLGVRGAATIAIDTDKSQLDAVDADTKLLVGKSLARGIGAGGSAEVGQGAIESAAGAIEDLLAGASLVFVTAGLGGGTGTGAAPAIARIAKRSGATVVGVVSLPFHVERSRVPKAERGLIELRAAADTVIALENDRLLRYAPNVPVEQAYRVMDALIAETLKGIAETITQPSLIGLNEADVRAAFGHGGACGLLYGESRAADPRVVVREALEHAFVDADPHAAKGALVHLTGGPDLSLAAAEAVAEEVGAQLAPGASVTWGARVAPELRGRLRLFVILTGLARTPSP